MRKFLLLLSLALVESKTGAEGPGWSPMSKTGRLGEDGFLHWGNGQWDVARSDFAIGSELTLVATVLSPDGVVAEEAWADCTWKTPFGETWLVDEGGLVINSETFLIVEEAMGVTDMGPSVCGLRLVPQSESYFGDWVVVYSGAFEMCPCHLPINTQDEVADGLRIPGNWDPVNYSIYLNPGGATAEGHRQVFEGAANMTFLALEDTSRITFQADELNIRSIGLEATIDHTTIDFQRTLVTVDLSADSTALAGDEVTLEVVYDADVERVGWFQYGFYHQECSDNTADQCWFTQFQSTNARNAFPCLDEPGLKATFDVTLRNPAQGGFETVLSNMPQKAAAECGLDDVCFETSVAMPPYLVAITMMDHYLPKRDDSDDTGYNITVWAPDYEVAAGRADYTAAMAPKIVKYYEDWFEVPYALPKLDILSEGHLGFAMENYGLIIFDARAVLLNSDNTDDDDEYLVLSVVAHEILHMWFGNLVTCDWWDQTWLNEGFAEYIMNVATHALNPKLNAMERMYVDDAQYVMYYDQDPHYHWAMSNPVTTRPDVERKFGSFTYEKGASFVKMVQMILGEENFTEALINYLNKYKFDATVEEELFAELEEVAVANGVWGPENGPMGDTLKTWTDQPGFPLVTVTRECSADEEGVECSLAFTQEWLVNEPQDFDQLWSIPLTFAPVDSAPSGPAVSPNAWLKEASLPAVGVAGLGQDTPFLVNLDGYGYYRVNYPEENWRGLARVLREDRDAITPISRAMLICDVARLYELGHVTGEIYEDVLSYVADEDQYAPTIAYEECVAGTRKVSRREFLRRY